MILEWENKNRARLRIQKQSESWQQRTSTEREIKQKFRQNHDSALDIWNLTWVTFSVTAHQYSCLHSNWKSGTIGYYKDKHTHSLWKTVYEMSGYQMTKWGQNAKVITSDLLRDWPGEGREVVVMTILPNRWDFPCSSSSLDVLQSKESKKWRGKSVLLVQTQITVN